MNTQHTYKEAILVPLSKFREIYPMTKPTSQPTIASNVLYDKNLPADVKLKLFEHENKFEQQNDTTKPEIIEPIPVYIPKITNLDKDIADIISRVETEYRRPARKLLIKLTTFEPDLIVWNDRHEITVDGQFYPGSDIVDILNWLPHHLRYNPPIGGQIVRRKLAAVKIYPKWGVPNEPTPESAPKFSISDPSISPVGTRTRSRAKRRKTSSTPQKGQGQWHSINFQ